MVDPQAVATELGGDAPIAVSRELGADVADPLDDRRIPDRLSRRLLVVARAREAHKLASSRDGEAIGPLTIDVLPPRADRLLLETPLKKSSSMVSRPTIRSRAAIFASYS